MKTTLKKRYINADKMMPSSSVVQSSLSFSSVKTCKDVSGIQAILLAVFHNAVSSRQSYF